MTRKRVVITGCGAVSPLGNTVADNWAGILTGKSGIGLIERFNTQGYSVRIGGSVKDLAVTNHLSPKASRKMDPFIQYGLIAAYEAVESSRLMDGSGPDPDRVGCAFGSGIGGLETIEKNHQAGQDHGPRRVSPFFVPGSIVNMVAGYLAIDYGFRGPNIAIATACTTGTHNLGYAARTIACGDAEAMVAGGAEMATTPTGLAGFASARALSTRNDEPEKASRPWDRDRDGFVLSDGAGALVLEELEHARNREAPILAEVVGFGMSDDAHHITAPPEDGAGAARAMRNALKDAGMGYDRVDYINAHGTSTSVGDLAEVAAIKSVFDKHAQRLAVSSTKSMTGHLLGAAGAVEAIYSALALREGVLPPTINLDDPDTDCDLDFVPHRARNADIDVVLSNSFGFGGTNASLVFCRYGA